MGNPNPNESTRFTSDNQPEGRGRPKGALSVKTTLKQLLESEIDWKDLAGKPSRLQALDAMLGEQIRKAIKEGDTGAFSAILDRLEGKPRQEIDQKTDAVQRVIVEYVENGKIESDESLPPEQRSDDEDCCQSGRDAVE